MLVNFWKCGFIELSRRREYPERKIFLFVFYKMILHTRIPLLALLLREIADKTYLVWRNSDVGNQRYFSIWCCKMCYSLEQKCDSLAQ